MERDKVFEKAKEWIALQWENSKRMAVEVKLLPLNFSYVHGAVDFLSAK